MNTRRKFLLQGSLATTALFTINPFKGISETLSPLTGYTVNDNTLILVLSGANNGTERPQAAQKISRLKNSNGNVLLLHAGETDDRNAAQLRYDAYTKAEECISLTGDYKIIYKGDIKVGVITAASGGRSTLTKTNDLATYLKKQKDCRVVVCLSQLGYKNKRSADDIDLATISTDIDVIISADPNNYSPHPVCMQNRNRSEVIIHSDSGNGFAFGNIEIHFDENRNKRSIAINNLITRTA